MAKVADKITVLRDGASVTTVDRDAEQAKEANIIRSMVGRPLHDRFPARDAVIGETVLEVKNWTAFHPIHTHRKIVDDVSFKVRRGEVVGIAGLMGAGRTELAMSLFGRSYGEGISGEVLIDGKPADTSTVARAIASGLCYATEDRKTYGLILEDSVRRNIPLANLEGISRNGIVNDNEEMAVATRYRAAAAHQEHDRRAEDAQSVRRQSAESGALQMAICRPGSADPRRADARHRCRREI